MFYKPFQNVLTRTNFFTQLVAVLLIVSISGAGCNKKNDAKSSEAAITAFSFETPAVTGTINGNIISVVVPYGTNVTNLVATFATTGTTVKIGDTPQVSGTTENNFTNPVIYTVTSQDGRKIQDYNVAVTPIDTKYVAIPDDNFRAYLKTVVSSAFGTGGDIDKLNIYHTSVTGLTSMVCNNLAITDLTGIEYFVALTTLYCYSNQLKDLDVSKNAALTTLYCYSNQLKDLDVSKNTDLTTLYCYANQLKDLDVSKNTDLTGLSCSSNSLTVLDVRTNTALTYLDCSSNQLTALDVSKNTALTNLYCDSNQLTTLDLSANPALIILYCSNNKLTTLDISSQKSWSKLYIYDNILGENPITTLKINVAQKYNPEVKKVKTTRGADVTISTYTNNSTEAPVDPNYIPL